MNRTTWSRWLGTFTPRRGKVRNKAGRYQLSLGILEDRTLLSSNPVGEQFLVNETFGPPENPPALAVVDDFGNFVVAWESFEEDGSGFGVYAKLYWSTGAYVDRNGNGLDDDSFRVNATRLGNQLAPAVASDGLGRFIIAWQGEDRENGGYDIYYRRGSLTEGLVSGQARVNNLLITGNQTAPAVAMDASANPKFIISWQGEDVSQPELGLDVYARRGQFDGGLQGNEFLVNTDRREGDQSAPAVTMARMENSFFFLAWQGAGEEVKGEVGQDVFGKLYRSGAVGSTAEFVVNETLDHDQIAPAVTLDWHGNLLVAWQAEGQQGSGSDVFARAFFVWQEGDTLNVWAGTEFRVNQQTERPQRAPAIAMDYMGNILVSWQSQFQDGTSWGIFARRYDMSGTAGDEFQVNNVTTSGPQITPALAVALPGHTIIAWMGPDVPEHGEEGEGGHKPAVHARLYSNVGATPLDDEYLISQRGGLEDARAPAAVDAQGRYVVVWQSWEDVGDRSSMGIYARRFEADGTPLGAAMLVNTTTVGNQSKPAVAVSAGGNFVVVWQAEKPGGSGYNIFARRYNATTGWEGSQFRVNASTENSHTAPAVALDATGNFTVVWQRVDTDGQGIFARRYWADGSSRAGQFRVNTFTALDQVAPVIAANASGQFAIAWVSDHRAQFDPNDTEKSIFVRWYEADGTPAGREFLVHNYVKDAQEHPALALAANGNFVIAWQSINQERLEEGVGSSWGVYARQFHPDGTSPQAREFRVNETADGPQRYASVGGAADGAFVIAWQSQGQDGSSWGVFKREYLLDGTPETGEELVNGWTDGPQILPAVARAANGNFAIFWSGQGPEHTDGVHGQLFQMPQAASGEEGSGRQWFNLEGVTEVIRLGTTRRGTQALFGEEWLAPVF